MEWRNVGAAITADDGGDRNLPSIKRRKAEEKKKGRKG